MEVATGTHGDDVGGTSIVTSKYCQGTTNWSANWYNIGDIDNIVYMLPLLPSYTLEYPCLG